MHECITSHTNEYVFTRGDRAWKAPAWECLIFGSSKIPTRFQSPLRSCSTMASGCHRHEGYAAAVSTLVEPSHLIHLSSSSRIKAEKVE